MRLQVGDSIIFISNVLIVRLRILGDILASVSRGDQLPKEREEAPFYSQNIGETLGNVPRSKGILSWERESLVSKRKSITD